jgi:hypothetical protein
MSNDLGPQRGPSSVSRIEAQRKAVDRELDDYAFTFAEGRWFVNVCPDCGESNGAGVVNDKHLLEHYERDPYDPCNVPCMWCEKGPMVRRFVDDFPEVRNESCGWR